VPSLHGRDRGVEAARDDRMGSDRGRGVSGGELVTEEVSSAPGSGGHCGGLYLIWWVEVERWGIGSDVTGSRLLALMERVVWSVVKGKMQVRASRIYTIWKTTHGGVHAPS
jgi:hypothetical protein